MKQVKAIFLYALVLITLQACNDDSVAPINKVSAVFEAKIAETVEGGNIRFLSTSNTNVISWEWAFEGGSPATSTEQNPTITYNTPGTYDVKLIVRSDDDEAVSEQLDYVTVQTLKNVTAAFSADNTTPKTGDQVTFTSTSNTNVTSWEWTFEGGTPASSTAQSPVVTYDNAGSFKVSLKVSSENNMDILEQTDFIEVSYSNTRAITFFGTNHIDVGNLPSPATNNQLTLSAWIKTSIGGRRIISKQEGTVDYFLKLLPDGKVLLGGAGNSLTSTIALNDGEWHHIVAIMDGSGSPKRSIYIDGTLDREVIGTVSLNDNTDRVTIGSWKSGSEKFIGDIAEVFITYDALSAQQVSNVYNACRLGATDITNYNIIGYWDFGNTNGDKIPNLANSALSGTFYISNSNSGSPTLGTKSCN